MNEQHKISFQKVLDRWQKDLTHVKYARYLVACYVLAIPIIFEKAGKDLYEQESPVTWMHEWLGNKEVESNEWYHRMFNLPDWILETLDAKRVDEAMYLRKLSSKITQLCKFALILSGEGCKDFNFLLCLFVLDVEYSEILKSAMDLVLMYDIEQLNQIKPCKRDRTYFVDEQHKYNFQIVTEKWPQAQQSEEYRSACYIMATPIIFSKVSGKIDEFEDPVSWMWKYLDWKEEEPQDKDHEAWYRRKPYDLSGSMLQLGKLALNNWNSYQEFNLMDCLSSLDDTHLQVALQAIKIRSNMLS